MKQFTTRQELEQAYMIESVFSWLSQGESKEDAEELARIGMEVITSAAGKFVGLPENKVFYIKNFGWCSR